MVDAGAGCSMEIARKDPPFAATEKEMLIAWLDYHRATLLMKVNGVNDEDLRRRVIPSSALTLLGLVKHLAYVERVWFQAVLVGLSVELPWGEADPDANLRIEPHETTADILAFYQAEVQKSREILATHDLDQVAQKPRHNRPPPTLRWIMVHMIEEFARHNGHADLIREAIDGVVGE